MGISSAQRRLDLIEQATVSLNRYSRFASRYRVTFSLTALYPEGLPRIGARMERSDGLPLAESAEPLDVKLSHLNDQTAILRPFFLPRSAVQWKEDDINQFAKMDFDYALVIGYTAENDGKGTLASLYLVPADAMKAAIRPDADGVYRRLRLATFYVSQISLEPEKNFARFLYLSERMQEGLEYEYDTFGRFLSTES